MRILMFGWEFPPCLSGGLGTACQGITDALTGLGQEVIFVHPRFEGLPRHTQVRLLNAADYSCDEGEEKIDRRGESRNDLDRRAIDSPLQPYTTEDQYRKLMWRAAEGKHSTVFPPDNRSGGYGPDLLAEVARYGRVAGTIAREECFDVIHGHDWTSVPACLQARSISGKPYIYHAHALEFDRSGENINPAIYDLEKYGMEMADQVIAVSHYTKENIVARYGLDAEKVTVVHNALSHRESGLRQRYQKRDEEKSVLFLGRITFQKGPDYFVEAAALVAKHVPGVRFVMAGTGDMLPGIIEKIAELGMGRIFHFTGFLQGEEVERIYAMSDLYVMPSVSEPFGISPLEAMLYDVPVIIARRSGVAEILHHALKVDFWNVREMADKMIALLQHPALVRELTANAREELKKIRWEVAAEQIISVYRHCMADTAPQRSSAS